jgi:hypothetical protein
MGKFACGRRKPWELDPNPAIFHIAIICLVDSKDIMTCEVRNFDD